MFLKIFKYEFKSVLKVMIITIAVSAGLALLLGTFVRILNEIAMNVTSTNAQVYLSLVSGFMTTIARLGISAALVVQEIILFIRFYKSVSSDEAYLTFTLPATAKEQHRSRTLVVLLWGIISAAVMLVDLFIFEALAYGNSEYGGIISELRTMLRFTDIPVILFLEIGVLEILADLVIGLEIMLAIMVANKVASKFKIGATIGFIALFYYAQVAILLLSVVLLVIAFTSIEAFVANSLPFIEAALLGYIVVFALVGFLAFFFTGKLFEKINV